MCVVLVLSDLVVVSAFIETFLACLFISVEKSIYENDAGHRECQVLLCVCVCVCVCVFHFNLGSNS